MIHDERERLADRYASGRLSKSEQAALDARAAGDDRLARLLEADRTIVRAVERDRAAFVSPITDPPARLLEAFRGPGGIGGSSGAGSAGTAGAGTATGSLSTAATVVGGVVAGGLLTKGLVLFGGMSAIAISILFLAPLFHNSHPVAVPSQPSDGVSMLHIATSVIRGLPMLSATADTAIADTAIALLPLSSKTLSSKTAAELPQERQRELRPTKTERPQTTVPHKKSGTDRKPDTQAKKIPEINDPNVTLRR